MAVIGMRRMQSPAQIPEPILQESHHHDQWVLPFMCESCYIFYSFGFKWCSCDCRGGDSAGICGPHFLSLHSVHHFVQKERWRRGKDILKHFTHLILKQCRSLRRGFIFPRALSTENTTKCPTTALKAIQDCSNRDLTLTPLRVVMTEAQRRPCRMI